MLKDLKEKVETKYEDIGNFRKVVENIKNGDARNNIRSKILENWA